MASDFVYLGLALAVFAVGLQYIPIEFFFRMFAHRIPSKEEFLMIKKTLGIMACLALVVIAIEIIKIIVDWGVHIYKSLASESLWIRATTTSACVVIIVIFLVWFAHRLLVTAKKIKIEPTETEILTAKLNELIDVLKNKIDTPTNIENGTIVKLDITLEGSNVEKPNEPKKEKRE